MASDMFVRKMVDHDLVYLKSTLVLIVFLNSPTHRCRFNKLRMSTNDGYYFHLEKYSQMESTTCACCSWVNSGYIGRASVVLAAPSLIGNEPGE